jgi:hypothetical protein
MVLKSVRKIAKILQIFPKYGSGFIQESLYKLQKWISLFCLPNSQIKFYRVYSHITFYSFFSKTGIFFFLLSQIPLSVYLISHRWQRVTELVKPRSFTTGRPLTSGQSGHWHQILKLYHHLLLHLYFFITSISLQWIAGNCCYIFLEC